MGYVSEYLFVSLECLQGLWKTLCRTRTAIRISHKNTEALQAGPPGPSITTFCVVTCKYFWRLVNTTTSVLAALVWFYIRVLFFKTSPRGERTPLVPTSRGWRVPNCQWHLLFFLDNGTRFQTQSVSCAHLQPCSNFSVRSCHCHRWSGRWQCMSWNRSGQLLRTLPQVALELEDRRMIFSSSLFNKIRVWCADADTTDSSQFSPFFYCLLTLF